jgi:guanylate kinase
MSTSLFVISAPSGAGKTTLCNKLLEDFPVLMLSISSTTRAKRGAEQDGKDYFFITKEAFEKKIAENGFAEWARVHGNYYGTSKDFVERAFKSGRSLLLDIDVQGAASMAEAFPKETVRIFISPPSMKALEDRLLGRGEDDSRSIQVRLTSAKTEMQRIKEFDHVVINDSLERAYGELKTIVAGRLGAK